MDEDLLNRIRTKEEADKLVEEIDILLSSFYEQKGEGFDYAMKTQVRYWVANRLSEIFSKQTVDKIKFLEDLKERLLDCKNLVLGIAFEPTQESINTMSEYVKKNFGDKTLLEINYMPDLIAGAVVIYEGNYLDLSIKKIFEKEIRENKNSILQYLTNT